MQKSLEALGDRNISVFSTPEGIAIYKKFGFDTGEQPTGIHQSKFKPKKGAFEGILDLCSTCEIFSLQFVAKQF